jgi:hypothetical protein
MTRKFVIGSCVAGFLVGLILIFVLTEPREDIHATDLILGTNGDSDVLVLTSQSAAILPAQVDDVTDLWGISPVEFLKSLKMERSTTDEYIFREPVKHWISRRDLPGLLALADSQEPCASVALETSSVRNLRGSTMGQEALFLLEGYRTGAYPPAPNSVVYDPAQAKELTDWCRAQAGPSRD